MYMPKPNLGPKLGSRVFRFDRDRQGVVVGIVQQTMLVVIGQCTGDIVGTVLLMELILVGVGMSGQGIGMDMLMPVYCMHFTCFRYSYSKMLVDIVYQLPGFMLMMNLLCLATQQPII